MRFRFDRLAALPLGKAYQGLRRFRCRACGKRVNECSGGVLNRTQGPDIIAPTVLWHLRYKLSLRDLSEMFPAPGIVFSPP